MMADRLPTAGYTPVWKGAYEYIIDSMFETV